MTRIINLKAGGQHNSKIILFSVIGYTLALLLFLQFAADGYNNASRIVAWLVFVCGSLPMVIFIHKRPDRLPMIEVILLAYVNAFSLPVFFESENTLMVKKLFPEFEPVTECLLIVLLAISAMWLGFKLAPYLLNLFRLPKMKLRCDNRKLFNLGVFLCLASLSPIAITFIDVSAFYKTLVSPELGIALISLLYYSQQLSKRKKVFSIIVLSLLILKGVMLGMTQHILQAIVIWFVCRWLVTRKLELRYVAMCVIAFVLIQPVKLNYRGHVWGPDAQTYSAIEKIELFSDLFYDTWFSSDKKEMDESIHTRTSLLLQTAHVIDWTPKVVPYRNGETLYFMLVTRIPRFVWPDKPIAQQSNIDYAINYGVTSVAGTETTMFGVGQVGEVIMNFGLLGIFPMFILLGILSYIPVYVISIRKGLFSGDNSLGSNMEIASLALSTSVLFKFIFIGSTVADSYGGMVQLIIVQGGMLYLFARASKSVRS